MKNNIIVSALLCLSISLFGQVQIGIKGQFSSSLTSSVSKDFVKVNPIAIYQINFETASNRQAIGLSLYGENKYLFFNSDFLYSTSGRHFSLQSMSSTRTPLDPGIRFDTKESNAKIALNAGLRYKDMKIGLGPEFLYQLTQEENFSTLESITMVDKKLNSGFNFLVGYIINRHLHLDFKFTYMFQDVSNEFEFDGIPLDMRKNPKFVEVGLAYYL